MPKPNKKNSYGERKRITEKEKYRVLADAQTFAIHANKLRAIPNQLDEETQISPDTRAMLDAIANDLVELNAVWREYSTAYLNVTRTQKDEMEKEVNTMKRLLSGFNRIKEQMDAFQNEKNPVEEIKVDERKIAEREEFAECYASVASIAGHYHEMTNGTLEVPEEQKSKMIVAKKDINIISEYSVGAMESYVKSKKYAKIDLDYADRLDTPLFSHEPTPDDIMQGHIGDCYFISALSAAAASNPQIIRDMMKDNGDGTVTVRLFNENEKGKLEPIYINVEKSVPVFKLRKEDGSESVEDMGATGALWVQMLEKAFAASGIHRNDKERFSETVRSYSDISGGRYEDAFRVMLGRQNIKMKRIYISLEYSETDNPKVMNKLYKEIKESVVDRNIIYAGPGSTYIGKNVLAEYNKAVSEALTDNGKTEEQLSKEELHKIRENVAKKVFCGVLVDVDEDTGVPTVAGHGYSLIDAYEKDGQKYVLVRNPHGIHGYKEGEESSRADKGYCEIPLEKFAGIFGKVASAKPLEPKFYQDFSSEYHSPLSKLYHGFLDSRSWRAKASLGLSLSKESRDLKRALQKIHNIQKEQFPSRHSLINAYQELDQAAKAYIEKHQNDNMAEMKDFTNRRLTIAKACRALSGSFLGHSENERDVQADIHRIGRMMVTDRGVYVTQKLSKQDQVHPDAKGIFTDARVSKALMPIDGDKLFDIAFTEHAYEIPGKVIDEVNKAANEKQTRAAVQNEAVVENANNIEDISI